MVEYNAYDANKLLFANSCLFSKKSLDFKQNSMFLCLVIST